MRSLSYTLVTDGSFDKILKYPVDWLLDQWANCPGSGQWADPNRFSKTNLKLYDKIKMAMEYYPCELIFIHRDAETMPRDKRVGEIEKALASVSICPAVCIIPVRMTEAWLLFNESLLRQASGNPLGREPLSLPRHRDIESLPDPKNLLHKFLRIASGASGRRARSFNFKKAAYRLAELIDDFSPLRELPAFKELENDLHAVLQKNGWLKKHAEG